MTPLVSVIMPCYNSAHSLPLALASLVAQSYENWECVLVDDGSIDSPGDVVDRVGDPRIRFFRLEPNRGRGAARQFALEQARGELLSLLDADDWIYPSKLARQVDLLNRESGLAFASTGMAIVDERNDIIGVRCRAESTHGYVVAGPLPRPAPSTVAHAPSMIRMAIAKETGYDSRLSMVEDFDFLLKIMMNHSFAVASELGYVYHEQASASLGKMLCSLRNNREIFRAYRRRFPVSYLVQTAKAFAKTPVYFAAFASGQQHRLFTRRSFEPTVDDVDEFLSARRDVYRVLDRFWQPPPGWRSGARTMSGWPPLDQFLEEPTKKLRYLPRNC